MSSSVTRDRAVDVVVIGGGIAGLSAALMLGRARRSVCVIDSGAPRNRNAAAVHAVLGHEGLAPGELLARGRDELSRYDVEVRDGRVTDARSSERAVSVTLADGSQITARALVLASGIVDDLPDIPGVAELWGTRVLHCPYCHGWEVRERALGVLAAGQFSIHQVEMLRQWSDDVTYFTNGSAADLDATTRERLDARNITLVDTTVTALRGVGPDDSADDGGVVVETADGARTRVAAVLTGGYPRFDDALVDSLGLELGAEPGSGIAVDPMNATSAPRVYAAGNVVVPWASIPIAMASGTQAGAGVNAALVAEDIDTAVSLARGPAAFWEDRYAGSEQSWSGKPNMTMVDIVGALAPGSALDLGCGEGADARWLAERGWHVTALDISPTAVERTRVLAAASTTLVAAGGSVDARVADLAEQWPVDGSFDLVVASFLHSPVALDRSRILADACDRVAPGGRLLVITHAEPPPWAPAEHRARFSGVMPDDELAALGLDPDVWTTELVEVRLRAAVSPSGEQAELRDGVWMVQRILSDDEH